MLWLWNQSAAHASYFSRSVENRFIVVVFPDACTSRYPDSYKHCSDMLRWLIPNLVCVFSTLFRLSNSGTVVQVQPVIDIFLGNSKLSWLEVELEVIVSMVNASVQLSLDHLTHKHSVSLLPSTTVLAPHASGPGIDKLDNSTWLLQLLGLIIQILQNSKQDENNGNEPQAGQAAGAHQGDPSREVQETAGSCSGNSPLCLANKVVARKELLVCLLECLNQCSADKLGTLNSTTCQSLEICPGDVKISEKPASVEDGIMQFLSVIQSNVTELGVLADGILAYLKTSETEAGESMPTNVKRLSDPLLWILFKVLNTSKAVAQFAEKGELFDFGLC